MRIDFSQSIARAFARNRIACRGVVERDGKMFGSTVFIPDSIPEEGWKAAAEPLLRDEFAKGNYFQYGLLGYSYLNDELHKDGKPFKDKPMNLEEVAA